MGIQYQESSTTLKRTQSRLSQTEEKLLEEQISKNRKEELDLVQKDYDTKYVDGKPLISIKIDGSWSKAGSTSNFGFVVVLSTRTGKVLDYQCPSY